jgi:hypothetical protein
MRVRGWLADIRVRGPCRFDEVTRTDGLLVTTQILFVLGNTLLSTVLKSRTYCTR